MSDLSKKTLPGLSFDRISFVSNKEKRFDKSTPDPDCLHRQCSPNVDVIKKLFVTDATDNKPVFIRRDHLSLHNKCGKARLFL
jgi:hypothetical protein